MLYFRKVFQQWYQRILANHDDHMPIWRNDLLRPAPHLLPYIDTIEKYYDSQITMDHKHVIGIHLRIESDLAMCGDVQLQTSRICNYFPGLTCKQATCIVATGAAY
jgi:hypothetical protein